MPRKIPKYMRAQEPPAGLPVDKSRLTPKSQRSYSIPDFYRDEEYACRGCGKVCVFKADTQKAWYEEEGKYIWARPNRCEDCHAEWRSIRKDIQRFPERLRGNPSLEDLRTMKAAMERFKALGGHHDLALYNRIVRFIDRAEEM